MALSALASISRVGAVRPGDLARIEGIAAPGMTRLVADLEQRGLVERSADANDRRSTLIRLTDAGEQELLAARASRSAWVGRSCSTASTRPTRMRWSRPSAHSSGCWPRRARRLRCAPRSPSRTVTLLLLSRA